MDQPIDNNSIAQAALDDMPLAALVLDLEGNILLCNLAGQRLLGGCPGDNILAANGWGWTPEQETWSEIWRRVTGSSSKLPFSLTNATSPRRLTFRGRRLHGDRVLFTQDYNLHHRFEEHAVQLRELNVQLAYQQQIEARLRSALELTSELRRELAHRVKNNLAIVTALLRAKARSTGNEETADALKEAASRIGSIAVVHEMLDVESHDERTNARVLLSRLLRHLQEAICPPHVKLSGYFDEVPLKTDAALQIGLLINELVTNAIKHAFIGRASGKIEVRFERRIDGFRLSVTDDGTGLIGGDSEGSGNRIIAALAGQLGGSPQRKNAINGMSWTLEIPFEAAVPEK